MSRSRREPPAEFDLVLVRWALDAARGGVHRKVTSEAVDLARKLSADLAKEKAENARLRRELALYGYEAES